MFQQFNSFGIANLQRERVSNGYRSLCKLAIPHLTSSPLGCNLLSQYHYINPISTEFQYPLWFVSFLLLAVTSLGLSVFSSFSMLQQLHRSWYNLLVFFNSRRYSMIPFILSIHQLLHVLLPRIFNRFLGYNQFARYSFQRGGLELLSIMLKPVKYSSQMVTIYLKCFWEN